MNAKTTIDQVSIWLEELGFTCKAIESEIMISTSFSGRNGRFSMVVAAQDDPHMLIVVVYLPLAVREENRPSMADTIARSNFGQLMGRFEINMGSGDMYFSTSIPLLDTTLTLNQLRAVLRMSIRASDLYCRAFSRLVSEDDLSPAEVVAEVQMAEVERQQNPSHDYR